jgi:uroporphyrinogen decarboxylase
MSMTSREIIRRNLEHSHPERIGLNFDRGRRSDFCSSGLGPSATWRERRWIEGNVEYYDDEWGNVWHRIVGMGAGGEVYKPVLADWSMLRDYVLPDLADPQRFERARQVFAQDKDHYRVAGLPGFPFAICRYMRKMEVYFVDLIAEREHIAELHERVTALLEAVIRRFAEAGADGVFFCEDWGVQDRLLISPAMWRDIFKPLFKRLCDTAHECGLHVLMHSCGYNWAILDDLAEVGIDCFQFDQTAIYGLERLAQKLRSLQVCLYSPVDIQKVLPTGDQSRIVEYARRMVELFAGDGGGLIAKNYGDLHGIGVEPEWDRWAYEAFLEFGTLVRA